MAVEPVLDFEPRNLPQEYLGAIGEVVAASAYAESIVESAIHGCAGIDAERGMAITTHMSQNLCCDVLLALATIVINDVDDLDELEAILEEIKMALLKRNDYAHNSWCRNPQTDEAYMVKTKARGFVEMEPVLVPVDDIKRDANEIYQAGMRLFVFLGTRGLLPAMPQEAPRAHKSKSARKQRRRTQSNK